MQQIKKSVLRPHISQVAPETIVALTDIRNTLMADLNERNLNVQFKQTSAVRKLVMLVLVSINHLVPADKAADAKSENDKSSDPEISAHIIDLTTNLAADNACDDAAWADGQNLSEEFSDHEPELQPNAKSGTKAIDDRCAERRVEAEAGETCEEEVVLEDVDSSKGSAWPSETSRLTPLHSNYQMTV